MSNTDVMDGRKTIVLGNRAYRHMAKAVLLEEANVPDYVRRTILLILAVLVAFLGWASVARLDVVTAATGEIVPSSSMQVVQHMDGGTITAIAAREGQLVKAGEILMSMDRGDAESDLEQTLARYWSLAVKAERLRAYAQGREVDFSQVPEQYAGLIEDQTLILETHRTATTNQNAVISAQIAQARSDIERIDQQIATAQREVGILNQLSDIRTDLAQEGLVTKVLSLDTQRTLVVAQGELRRLRDTRETTLRNITELESRLTSLGSDLRQVAMDEMGAVNGELAQVTELVAKLKERLARMDIRAPVAGVVQELKYNTVGGVVTPGATVMRIVPADDLMQAEVRISTDDVGHVGKGQNVRVKVSTYDFMRYGVVEGEVVSVSASSFLDEESRPYFKGIVGLKSTNLGEDESKPVLPGMTITADIVTDQKTVLDYLLRPVALAFKEGLRER